MIEKGYYFCAFSHIPFHGLDLPEGTFTCTCLREPVHRVLSHCKMLLAHRQEGGTRRDYEEEAEWLGSSFRDFLDRIPQKHLLRQLCMLSPTYSMGEAYERITSLSHLLFVQRFGAGLSQLLREMGFPLAAMHTRQARESFEPDPADLARLRQIVLSERTLYERLCERYKVIGQSSCPSPEVAA